MNRTWLMRIALAATDLAFILVCILLPRHAYDWMRELDPGMQQLPEDPLRDIRLLLTSVLLLLAASLHAVRMVAARGPGPRAKHAVLIVLLAALWSWRNLFAA